MQACVSFFTHLYNKQILPKTLKADSDFWSEMLISLGISSESQQICQADLPIK